MWTHLCRYCLYTTQVWNVQDAEEECLVMAVRTGLNTSLGSMIRERICPSRLLTPQHPFIPVRKEKFTLFSNHNRSLLRQQPGAYYSSTFTCLPGRHLYVVTGSIKGPEQRMSDCNDDFPNSVHYRYLKLYLHSCLPDICNRHVCAW